jgi:uncharacterized protein YbjT (DUF2867 family)
MKKFAVVGASNGTGLEIVRLLSSRGHHVRAISRRTIDAAELIEPVSADVTDATAIAKALEGNFDAIFFTVDIHRRFASKKEVRALMFDGCMNVIRAAKSSVALPRLVLLSVIGPDKPTWVWHLLNLLKRGMRQNVLDREVALQKSGLPYVIARAARLVDSQDSESETLQTTVTHSVHKKLDMKTTISRKELARVLVAAAQSAPTNSVWDIFGAESRSVPTWIEAT